MAEENIVIIFPGEGESLSELSQRIKTEGNVLLVLFAKEWHLRRNRRELLQFLHEWETIDPRPLLALRERRLTREARRRGFTVLNSATLIKDTLKDHPRRDEVLQAFSPKLFRQLLRSRLRVMGLLALPKLRIGVLITLSSALFLFVIFRLLPSAEVRIWPRHDTITQTANIFLVLEGHEVDVPPRVRTMPLIPLTVTVQQEMTFDEVSREFVGQSAEVPMTIINESDDLFEFIGGTRFMNQAGVIFRTEDPLEVGPHSEVTARAKADPFDIYGTEVGERGNVPKDVRWEIPGLESPEQKLVYGLNRTEGKGGEMAYRRVLRKEDLDVAQRKLEQELLSLAKQLTEEERQLRNARDPKVSLDLLAYEELTEKSFSGFLLPTAFIGEEVETVPIEGSITHTAYAYNAQEMLERLKEELLSHVREGKRIIEESIDLSRLVVHVIDYSDDLDWIKLTVDLSGTEEFILDPLSAQGAKFGKRVRELTTGLRRDEALRILRNMAEVERAEIAIFPPWKRTLPLTPAHISIEPQ